MLFNYGKGLVNKVKNIIYKIKFKFQNNKQIKIYNINGILSI